MFSFEAKIDVDLKTRTDLQPPLYAYGDKQIAFSTGRLHDCHHKHCGKVFQDPVQLEKHLRSHSRKLPYICDWPGCGQKFTLNGDLKKHGLLSHFTWMLPYSCTWPGCDKKFVYNSNLKSHMRTHIEKNHTLDKCHNGQYNCQYENCDKNFTNKSQLNSHVLIHTGERPFACEWPGCNKKSNQKGNLKQHMLTHTGERSFECELPGCGAKFARKSALKSHKLKHSDENTQMLGVYAESQIISNDQGAQVTDLAFDPLNDLAAFGTVNEIKREESSTASANEFRTGYQSNDQQQYFHQFSPIQIQWRLTDLIKSCLNESEINLEMPEIKVEPKEEPQDLPEELDFHEYFSSY